MDSGMAFFGPLSLALLSRQNMQVSTENNMKPVKYTER